MRDLFNTDKPLFAVLTKLTYSAYLNILWLVCSLPIVTIGASTTALFYVTLKMAEDRDDGLTRMFFKAFRENFKPATKLWLILLAVGSFLAADGFVLRRMWSENIFWTLLTAVLIGAAVLYGIVLLYAFPLLARFENTTFGILKTAFLVGVRYLFCTLLMAAIYGSGTSHRPHPFQTQGYYPYCPAWASGYSSQCSPCRQPPIFAGTCHIL